MTAVDTINITRVQEGNKEQEELNKTNRNQRQRRIKKQLSGGILDAVPMRRLETPTLMMTKEKKRKDGAPW